MIPPIAPFNAGGINGGGPADPAAEALEFLRSDQNIQELVTYLGEDLKPEKVRSYHCLRLSSHQEDVHFDIVNCTSCKIEIKPTMAEHLKDAGFAASHAIAQVLIELAKHDPDAPQSSDEEWLEFVEMIFPIDKLIPSLSLYCDDLLVNSLWAESSQLIIVDDPVLRGPTTDKPVLSIVSQAIGSWDIKASAHVLGLPCASVNAESLSSELQAIRKQVLDQIDSGNAEPGEIDLFAVIGAWSRVITRHIENSHGGFTKLFEGESNGSTLLDAIHKAEADRV